MRVYLHRRTRVFPQILTAMDDLTLMTVNRTVRWCTDANAGRGRVGGEQVSCRVDNMGKEGAEG